MYVFLQFILLVLQPKLYCECIWYFLFLCRKEADGKKYVRYEVIGVNNVAVPTHFYKVIVGETNEGKLEMEAFVMPNMLIDDNTPLTNFQVSFALLEVLLLEVKFMKKKLERVCVRVCVYI